MAQGPSSKPDSEQVSYSARHHEVFEQQLTASGGDSLFAARNAAYVRLLEIRRTQTGMLSDQQLNRAELLFAEIGDPSERWRIYSQVADHINWKPDTDSFSPEEANVDTDHEWFLVQAEANGIDSDLLAQVRSLDPSERFHVSQFLWEMSEDLEFRAQR